MAEGNAHFGGPAVNAVQVGDFDNVDATADPSAFVEWMKHQRRTAPADALGVLNLREHDVVLDIGCGVGTDLNGIQTQSARTYNLIGELDSLSNMGVDVLRISPQLAHSAKIIGLFRACIEQTCSPHAAQQQLEKFAPDGLCDGYWQGRPGLEQSLMSSQSGAR